MGRFLMPKITTSRDDELPYKGIICKKSLRGGGGKAVIGGPGKDVPYKVRGSKTSDIRFVGQNYSRFNKKPREIKEPLIEVFLKV